MNLFPFFRRKKRKSAEDINAGKTSPSVAKAVLAFLALGLTDGIESIIQSYKPTKVDEFVTVSKAILNALKKGYESKFSGDFVVMSMKVNEQQKQIELTQLGRNVMLSLDATTDIITNITLTEIYANLRKDIIKHPEIYGKELHLVASTFPDPGKQP
jgi:hypothetical protein